MKKVLLALAGLALVGAGCSGAATTNTTATTSTTTQTPPAATNTGTSANAGAGANVTTPVGNANTGVTAQATVKVNMTAGNFMFSPTTITAKVGQPVEITFTDVAGFHGFVIDGVTSNSISTGSVVKFNAPSAPGRYPYYCNVANHRAMGMEGTLIVQ